MIDVGANGFVLLRLSCIMYSFIHREMTASDVYASPDSLELSLSRGFLRESDLLNLEDSDFRPVSRFSFIALKGAAVGWPST